MRRCVSSVVPKSSKNIFKRDASPYRKNRVRMTIATPSEPVKVYELEIWRKQTPAETLTLTHIVQPADENDLAALSVERKEQPAINVTYVSSTDQFRETGTNKMFFGGLTAQELLFLFQRRAQFLAHPDAALPDGGAGARALVRPRLRRSHRPGDARLHPVRDRGAAGRLARRPVERRADDGALFPRVGARGGADGPRARADGAARRADAHRPIRFDLPPGRHRLARAQRREARPRDGVERHLRLARRRLGLAPRRRPHRFHLLARRLPRSRRDLHGDRHRARRPRREGKRRRGHGGPEARGRGQPARHDPRLRRPQHHDAAGRASSARSSWWRCPKIFEDRLGDLLGSGTLGVGFLVSAVYIVTAVAQIPGGWCADRFPLKTVYLLAWAAQAPLYILAAPLLGLPLLATVILVSVANTFATPVENVLLARYTPARWRATAYGAKFVLALGVSALGVPLIGFVYAQTGGFYWLFVILAATAAVVAAAAAFLPGTPRAAAARGTLAQQPAE